MRTHAFDQFESNVKYYCRHFPVVFARAKGAWMTDTVGNRYLDLLSGAGALNYGHNNPGIIGRVIEYLSQGDGIVHSLDMHTLAKAEFITTFQKKILAPRNLQYKLQFPGPTGANAVEAALKLARKVTGRTNLVSFTNGFHGMSLGALAMTANPVKRAVAGLALPSTTFMPYDGFFGPDIDTLDFIEPMLRVPSSGVSQPAALLIELVQGEGGLNAASTAWLNRLAVLARDIGALLIVDDIQAGNGRTGTFFSFEPHGIRPDIVILSKSLSGFGTPFSLVLLQPHLDVWSPGEHNGTFRGNNLAFVGATAAIDIYWSDLQFQATVQRKSELARARLEQIAGTLPHGAAHVKGRGMLIGLEFADRHIASSLARRLFDRGVIIETSGADNQVLKLLPPLTIEIAELEDALDMLERSIISEPLAHVAPPARAIAAVEEVVGARTSTVLQPVVVCP
jgi:diaminobutyrate-2-oxoglutarate transaminase